MERSLNYLERSNQRFRIFHLNFVKIFTGDDYLKELRCTNCGKLLLKAVKEYEAAREGHELEVKCKRCHSVNKYKAK